MKLQKLIELFPVSVIAGFNEVEVGLRSADCTEQGLHRKVPYELIADRKAAVHRAIGLAQPGDTVLIAGKGHETYQILHNESLSFDDREVARLAIGG